MPLTDKSINRKKATDKEQWISLGGGCYLVIAKAPRNSKRFVGKTRIPNSKGKLYSVPLGIWGKDINDPLEVINKWDEMKKWGKENKTDLRKYGERLILRKSLKTLDEVFGLFLQHKSKHIKPNTYTTIKNRLNQILKYLPDGILIDEFAGYEGTQLIKELVLNPSIAKGSSYNAKRHRRLLSQVFDYAVGDRLIHPEQLPYRLDKPFPFERNIPKAKPHPHLTWDEFRNKLIPDINRNLCNASRLTDLATKALLLMPTRASVVVSMEWSWFDGEKNCWVIPSQTEGLKRDFGDELNDHFIPHTPQLERLMNELYAINGKQKYVFFSPYQGNNPYLSKQTPNDHLKNLGYGGRQDAHGFRHLATNALVDVGGFNEKMVSRCLGHLHNDGAIGHYDFAERIKPRREIHEYWNQLLIKEGLRI